MPRTVAPPPRNGDAAQGHWNAEESTAATDRAARPHDEPAPVPAHPMPVAAARTAATGGLIALLAVAAAGSVALTTVAVRSIATGLERITFGGPSLVLLVVGVALASAVALTLISRGWASPRSTTLVLTVALTAIWPLSGYALFLAPVAVVLIGLALTRDRLHPTPRRPGLDVLLVLGLGGAVLILAGTVTARVESTAPLPPNDGPVLADLAPLEEDADDAAARDQAAAEEDEQDARDDAAAAADEAGAPSDDDAPAAGDDDATAGDTDRTATPGDDTTGGDPASSGGDAPGGASPAAGGDAPSAAIPGDVPDPQPAARSGGAERFVRDYYADLNAQRFGEAWAKLSPAVQASLGPYARWKAGYGGTVSSRPRDFSVQGNSVTHLLVARDRGCESPRQFRVTWRLIPQGDQWAVTRLAAVAVGSQEC